MPLVLVCGLIFLSVMRVDALGLLVPAYFSPAPGGDWDSLAQASSRVPLTAILNPNNGPSAFVNSNYVRAVNALRKAGGQVIGYVYSSYTLRSLPELKADVDRYDSFYMIDGFFIDEVTNDADGSHLAYYQELYQYIKAKRSTYTVIGNPGTTTQASYLTLPAFGGLVTFESNTGYSTYVPDAWTRTKPPSAFSHLCYDVATAGVMTNYLQLAVDRNAGYIYVTDDRGSNPWDTLPRYWAEEIGLVEAINYRAATNRPPSLKISLPTNQTAAIAVSGAAGRYVLQASNDFTNWQAVSTNVSATGNFAFADSVTNDLIRVYRTVQ